MKSCVPSFDNHRKKFPQFEENIDCVESYLIRYEEFAENPNNRDVRKELYNETLKLLDNAQKTRLKQANIALKQAEKFSKELVEKYPDVFSIKNGRLVEDYSKSKDIPIQDMYLAGEARFIQSIIKDVMNESIKYLKNMSNICQMPNTPYLECIETFVSAAHAKGPYIPLGCGLPFPEFWGYIEESREEPINIVGRLMAEETKDTLDCLHFR